MFVRAVTGTALALALIGAAPAPTRGGPARVEGAKLAQACKGRDGWSDAAPPARIFGESYYVGTCGISVVLIASPSGHILIDGATAEAAPSILANIRALGFDPRDVKLIVGSHEHLDHMGGFAALKAATGAAIAVREPARVSVETGKTDPADPQAGSIPDMAPVAVDRIIADGETVSMGNIAIRAIATPGHTSGGTSWTWRACEGVRCARIAYVDSLSAISRDGYRFTDHPERVTPFRATFERVQRLPCDILVTPHPSVGNVFERLSGREPLIDRDACARLERTMHQRLDARLAGEAKPL
jgi:metallo-beta-lactamase class B